MSLNPATSENPFENRDPEDLQISIDGAYLRHQPNTDPACRIYDSLVMGQNAEEMVGDASIPRLSFQQMSWAACWLASENFDHLDQKA